MKKNTAQLIMVFAFLLLGLIISSAPTMVLAQESDEFFDDEFDDQGFDDPSTMTQPGDVPPPRSLPNGNLPPGFVPPGGAMPNNTFNNNNFNRGGSGGAGGGNHMLGETGEIEFRLVDPPKYWQPKKRKYRAPQKQ